MMGSFSPSDLGAIYIWAALLSTAICAPLSAWLAARLTRGTIHTPVAIQMAVVLFRVAVATTMCFVALTEHLGFALALLVFGIPLILLLGHALPLFVLYRCSRNNPDIARARARLALAAFLANLGSVVLSYLMWP